MKHLGKVFREFRTSGKYSLKEAAGESCSTSQLSRFELGESDLAVSRFFETSSVWLASTSAFFST